MAQFRWHPAAQASEGGEQVQAGDARPTGQALVRPDRPALRALQAALGAQVFRIGAEDAPPPDPGAVPLFETLSGGTSGAPKRIRRTQASWIASFAVNARLFGLGPGCAAAVLGRLVHSLALYGAIETLHLGGRLHLLDRLRPDRQRAALAQHRVQVLYATPAQLRLMTEAGGAALPDLRLILVGGSKLDPALRANLAAMTPARVVEFYGAAETSFITLADDTTPPDSVGRPYPGVEIAVQEGEIRVRSPYLALGYGDAGSDIWHDGWVSVGEHGRMAEGLLYLAGRASRMVKIADQAVYPEEIEALLLALPGIRRAACLPAADPLRGHVLVAVLMGDGAQAGDILAQLRARLGPLKAPRRLIWRSDWPVLPSAKTDLAALAADIAGAGA